MRTLVISAPTSGSGKTITSLCIEVGLTKIGKKVTSFKFGPDFIDPMYHRLFTECYNLDPVMSSEEFVRYIFLRKSSEYNLIEGAMGLMDGESTGRSTLQLSQMLEAKIILCIDASSVGESIRGIVRGFKKHISGVVVTKVSSEKHLELLRNSLERENVKMIGYIMKSADLEIPTRHLGLVLPEEAKIKREELEKAFFRGFDVRKLLELFESSKIQTAKLKNSFEQVLDSERRKKEDVIRNIAVLTDRPFPFVYPENLLVLREIGFDVFEIKLEEALTRKTDVLLIPGGYPEIFAEEIKENLSAMRVILKNSRFVVAECGGLELLARKVIWKEKEIKGLGVFPFSVKIEDRLQAIGWRKLKNKSGETVAKGHEFRYGRILNESPRGMFTKYDSSEKFLGSDGFRTNKFLAFWTHIYFGSNPASMREIIYNSFFGNKKAEPPPPTCFST